MCTRLLLLFMFSLVASQRPIHAQPADLAPEATARWNGEAVPSLDLDLVGAYVHELVNEERRRHHTPPLQRTDRLDRMAYGHSADMADRDFFDHINLRGERVTERARRAGVRCDVGENLFQTFHYDAYRTVYTDRRVEVDYAWKTEREIALEAVQAWMESPAHRRTLLEAGYRSHGIGLALTDAFKLFVTQNLCR